MAKGKEPMGPGTRLVRWVMQCPASLGADAPTRVGTSFRCVPIVPAKVGLTGRPGRDPLTRESIPVAFTGSLRVADHDGDLRDHVPLFCRPIPEGASLGAASAMMCPKVCPMGTGADHSLLVAEGLDGAEPGGLDGGEDAGEDTHRGAEGDRYQLGIAGDHRGV